MNSKILIIAIAIAVIATVFMGCANNKNDITTTTLPSSQTTVSDTNTTDKAESEASSAVSKAGEKADKVGDDIGKGANDVADGVGGAVDDHVDTLFLDRLKHRPGVGDVQLRDVGGQVVVGRYAPKLPQGAPQLPPGARNQDIKHSSPYCSRTVPRPPPAAGGRCPWARARHPPAPGASRCPAWGRPTRWRPPIRGHRGCRTCIGIQPRRSAPRSRVRSREV